MNAVIEAKEPFVFYSRLNLLELTGMKARNTDELLEGIKRVPDAVIYHHTHHYLQQHQHISPEPPNDFAYWVSEILGDMVLGEKLASIDIMRFSSIDALRAAIIACFNGRPVGKDCIEREAPPGHEFQFIKAVTFVLPGGYAAFSLAEFLNVLRKITINSLYFHMFEARLRLGRQTNDFSNWLDTSLGEKELARQIARLDPYTHTMEGLRRRIVRLIEKRLQELG